ncbi:MAG: DUF192 domain-containing protein [Candidatus Cloacimonetes bacterium]|jgi:uncharacterized protein|nr:DUF192 domain-containing protein [Candidatus Cloacimonadota bacterium]HOH60639.1 DUF192 domain-containing protein [Candidatus Cloacimonadota bacterium]HPI26076.1 DUF192 domain-containing protein [Candidatus Cloacimonadota bacterium]
MKPVPSLVLLLMLLISFASCRAADTQSSSEQKPTFRKDGSLEIRSPKGELKASFEIEIVSSDYELARGLKYRESIGDNQAMLFVFDFSDYHSFWMQDTYLSLDMLFIDSDSLVVNIAKHTTPFSEDQIYPEKPIMFVLETIAGTADKLKLEPKDKVTWISKK